MKRVLNETLKRIESDCEASLERGKAQGMIAVVSMQAQDLLDLVRELQSLRIPLALVSGDERPAIEAIAKAWEQPGGILQRPLGTAVEMLTLAPYDTLQDIPAKCPCCGDPNMQYLISSNGTIACATCSRAFGILLSVSNAVVPEPLRVVGVDLGVGPDRTAVVACEVEASRFTREDGGEP